METDGLSSQYESSEILADLLATTPLVSDAWRRCNHANASAPGSFTVDRIGEVAYVAFSGVQTVRLSNTIDGCYVSIHGCCNDIFSSLRDNHDGKPAMVHPGFLHLYDSIYSTQEFQNQIPTMVSGTKSVIVTGHSIGGTMASLAALWLLSTFPSLSSLCITFGSPMLGNSTLSSVILQERWGGNFCHVVSKHDIVPRLLFSPLASVSTWLNHLQEYWHSHMRFSHQGMSTTRLSEKEIIEFFVFISTNIANATKGEEQGINLRTESVPSPFGSYLLCSEKGAICIDNSAAVTRMLYLMLISASPNSSIEEHLMYGDVVVSTTQQILKRGSFDTQGVPKSASEGGILLALEASGMARSQDSSIHLATRECLLMARQMGCRPNLNSAELAIRLSKVIPCRAQLEWYKNSFDDKMGYYDAFKLRNASRKESKANMNRIKLGQFWDYVIDMVQSNLLPHDFHKRAKWINASHFCQLHVEPLDIAEYYRCKKHKTKGHYLKHGREKRYEIFDRWWRERKVLGGKDNYDNNRKRSRYAGLTIDSCFWARVEEAKEWAENARSERDIGKLVQLRDKMVDFELYAGGLVQRKEVSRDVLAGGSSYQLWVNEWKQLKLELALRIPPPEYLLHYQVICRDTNG